MTSIISAFLLGLFFVLLLYVAFKVGWLVLKAFAWLTLFAVVLTLVDMLFLWIGVIP
jgi:hypothetical protein